VSISQIIKKGRLSHKFDILKEKLEREFRFSKEQKKVFFPYKAGLLHPVFDELKQTPPLISYVNKNRADLFHYIQGSHPKDFEKDHIIEIIDHALSILAPYNGRACTCEEYVSQIELARQLYLNNNLKKIIFTSNGQLAVFKKYFQDTKILQKAKVIYLPWKDNTHLSRENRSHTRQYLFIASNYQTKGVKIILDSWEKYCDSNITALLTLVSHDLPEDLKKNLPHTVTLVEKAPLSQKLKDRLYSGCDVVISTTLTDGIGAIEAIAYGKPVIIFCTQHSKDFTNFDNGVEVDVPINIYDEGYGILWKTSEAYLKVLDKYYNEGKFEDVTDRLVDVFKSFEEASVLEKMRQNAIKKYYTHHRIELRNKKLMEIYNECL
jgi:glycosyltransferase involved in cell wall biosynthesis